MDDTHTLPYSGSNPTKEEREHVLVRANTLCMPPPPRSPISIAKARRIYLKAVLIGLMMLTFIIFCILSIYWGSIYKISTNTHKMVGWVVDFDHGPIGTAITSTIQALPPSPTSVTWVIKDSSTFPGGVSDLIASIHDQDSWFAISVNAGASAALAAALASPEQHSDYIASHAVTGYGEEARNENAFRSVYRPGMDGLMQPIIARFAAEFVTRNFSALSQEQATAVVQHAPQLINRPFDYTVTNLIPFNVPVGPAITFVGMIFLLIMSFMAAMVSMGGREMSGFERTLPVWRLVLMRLTTDFVVYFFLSLFYGLLSVAFQVSFARHFGKGGFMVFWMLQWMGMLALGYALETMITLLTPRFMPMFLILWIVSDVSVSLFPIELLPGVFRYGHAMPFYNLQQGIRTIIFGTKNHLGLNFGVLFAWIGVSAITMPLATLLVRWNHARVVAKAEAKLAVKHSKVDLEDHSDKQS